MAEGVLLKEGGLRKAAAHRERYIPGEPAIWVFVMGDMTMFAAFFCQFIYTRAGQIELFNRSQQTLSTPLGALNTMLLLTGSLFVVLGVHAVKQRLGKAGTWLFGAAFACALAFGIDKVFEYGSKIRHGIFPSTNDFFTYYYLYTGIHALHLLIGMIFLGRMWQLSRVDKLTKNDIRFIEVGATYWHLVDLLWIVLFAILYLLN